LIADLASEPAFVALDGQSIYWLEPGRNPGSPAGRVLSARLDSTGSVAVLAEGIGMADDGGFDLVGRMVVDERALYVVRHQYVESDPIEGSSGTWLASIMKLSKIAGAPPKVLWTAQKPVYDEFVRDIAVDAEFVYFGWDGALIRVPK